MRRHRPAGLGAAGEVAVAGRRGHHYTIDPSAPARFNSAYMLVYFVGGSLGTAVGAATVEWFGWPATAAMAAAAIGVAATITVLGRQR